MTIKLAELLKYAEPIEVPEGFSQVSKLHPEMEADDEAMVKADREYFESHPYADYYYRKPYEVEIALFGSRHPSQHRPRKILVMKTDHEGIRIRDPIF